MKQKGKLSVSQAITEALKDTQRILNENGVDAHFTKYSLNTRIRAYIGSQYYADDEMIGRSMRKLRAKGVISYSHKGNGIYNFNIE